MISDKSVLTIGLTAAIALTGALQRKGSAARAPGRIQRASAFEVEPVFRATGINLAPYEEAYEVFVADGEILGASSFGWHDRGMGKIASFSVAVLPRARRMGIATRLVKSLVRQHPGARFEPWVVSRKMAGLLEGIGFDTEGRGWTPDTPYMTYEAPRRTRGAAPAIHAPPVTPPAPPAPSPSPPHWRTLYEGPIRLKHLGLDERALAQAHDARSMYREDDDARTQKIAALLAQSGPIPGLSMLATPGVGDRWQIILEVDPRGRPERTAARMQRLRRSQGDPSRGSASRLPGHLRFLDAYLGASHMGLHEYYPKTARGELRPGPGEAWFDAGGIQYLGDTDGRMVPIQADHLEPMPENTFHADKFSALVEAIERGDAPGVYPGYADLAMENGALTAQVRDGNHRTFAAIAAGGEMSWVFMSDRTRQDLDERVPGSEALYRAVRAAQRSMGAPLFVRETRSKVKAHGRDFERLVASERRLMELQNARTEYERSMLRRWGFVERTGWSKSEQMERPWVFWPERVRELKMERGAEWVRDNLARDPEAKAVGEAREEIANLSSELYDLRKKAGLKVNERIDPRTRKVVEH